MADFTYRYMFESPPQAAPPIIPTNPSSDGGSFSIPQSPNEAGGDVGGAIANKATHAVKGAVLSPLNQATGGMATPLVNLGLAAAKGASTGAVAGAAAAVAIQAVKIGIDQLGKRVEKMEAKASEANERDNALMRAGAKEFATAYKGGLFGVSSTTLRS